LTTGRILWNGGKTHGGKGKPFRGTIEGYEDKKKGNVGAMNPMGRRRWSAKERGGEKNRK